MIAEILSIETAEKIAKLEKENKHLKEEVKATQELAVNYKSRIDKAVEYMNEYNEFVVPDANIKSLIIKEEYKKVINILKGDNNE